MKRLAFTNVNVFDGKMSSEPIPNATMLIELEKLGKNGQIIDGKIKDIGKSDMITIPKETKIIDLNGK